MRETKDKEKGNWNRIMWVVNAAIRNLQPASERTLYVEIGFSGTWLFRMMEKARNDPIISFKIGMKVLYTGTVAMLSVCKGLW